MPASLYHMFERACKKAPRRRFTPALDQLDHLAMVSTLSPTQQDVLGASLVAPAPPLPPAPPPPDLTPAFFTYPLSGFTPSMSFSDDCQSLNDGSPYSGSYGYGEGVAGMTTGTLEDYPSTIGKWGQQGDFRAISQENLAIDNTASGPSADGLQGVTTITASVYHEGADTITNNWADPLQLAAPLSGTTSMANGSEYLGVNTTATVTVVFQVHFDTQAPWQQFDAAPYLGITVGPYTINVTLTSNIDETSGGVVVSNGGNIISQQVFGVFPAGEGGSADGNWDGSFPVDRTSAIPLSWGSELDCGANSSYPQGVSSNDTHFNWSLTLSLTPR